MNGMIKYKDFVGSITDVDRKNRIITGYLTAFGNKDHDGDIAEKGAFEKTIAERGPKGRNEIFFLNQHNWAQPHGKFAELFEDSKGLAFVSNKMPNTTFSNDAVELYAEGIVKEHSYGYNVLREKYDKEAGANILQEIKLYEGSNVTLGANPDTPFTGFKALTFDQVKDRTKSIMKMLRNGTLTDDTFLLLEIALKELQTVSYELGRKELITPEPEESTLEPMTLIEHIKEFRTQNY